MEYARQVITNKTIKQGRIFITDGTWKVPAKVLVRSVEQLDSHVGLAEAALITEEIGQGKGQKEGQ